jgi:tRNA (guanine37-N1)-methyltransferase
MILSITVITLFPDFFPGPLGGALLGKALIKKLWTLNVIPLRSFGRGKHQIVDDAPYGGGSGMVIRPDVIHDAVQSIFNGSYEMEHKKPHFIYPSPRGVQASQKLFQLWAQEKRSLVFLCGRYEGVDQRVLDHWSFEEINCGGDYVLMGGELPAMLMIEGTVRLLPGVVHDPNSLVEESFQNQCLEHNLYTRPEIWEGHTIPEVLKSGHHHHIENWKKDQKYKITQEKRPDLLINNH